MQHSTYFDRARIMNQPCSNNESSEVIDILLPVTFYFNPLTRLVMSKTSEDSLLANRAAELRRNLSTF